VGDFYTSKYPIINVTADLILWKEHSDDLLLIKRNTEPFKGKWALIGGYLDAEDIDLEEAARRECFEEVGYRPDGLQLFHCYSRKGRDPRGRTVTAVYQAEFKSDQDLNLNPDEVMEAQWFNLYTLPDMAFDHKEILMDMIGR
jgi:8-oxo-dGTP diphosphatase